METIILASESERRQDFFRIMGLPFRVIPSQIDEKIEAGIDPRFAAQKIAVDKTKAVNDILAEDERTWIAGADTVILHKQKIYGKPQSRDHAQEMLQNFQGSTHEVITGLALLNSRKNVCDSCSVTSEVSFAAMTEAEIDWYLDSGEWEGAAGSYKIQGLASCFITKISGSYTSIVGLPLYEFYAMLKSNGYPLWDSCMKF